MARRKYTDEQKAEALDLYESEGPTAVTKKLGIPKNTVHGWAKKAGRRTVRNEKAREATEAIQLDNAQRRALLIKRLYGVTESWADLLEDPKSYQTIMKGERGAEVIETPGFIPAQDKQREMTAIGIALDKAETLEKFDNDSGAAAAKGLLVALAEQIGVAGD